MNNTERLGYDETTRHLFRNLPQQAHTNEEEAITPNGTSRFLQYAAIDPRLAEFSVLSDPDHDWVVADIDYGASSFFRHALVSNTLYPRID